MTSREDLDTLRSWVKRFAVERGWEDLRSLKDLSLAIGIEVAELQELFLWVARDEEDGVVAGRRAEIEAELADVFIYLLAFADRISVDLVEVAKAKMTLNEERFPGSDDEFGAA